MALDRRLGQRREVARGDKSDALVGPAVRISEVAVVEAEFLGQHVHLLGERLLGAGDALGQYDRGVIA